MAIENVRHPIKDTVKADNSTYSSNKIESLIHSATELPEISIEDAGDVLMVNDEGEWAKGEIIVPQELPTPAAADIGKIVSVVSVGDEGAEYGLTTSNFITTAAAVVMNGVVTSAANFGKAIDSNNYKLFRISIMDMTNYMGHSIELTCHDVEATQPNKYKFNAIVYNGTSLLYYEAVVTAGNTKLASGTSITIKTITTT